MTTYLNPSPQNESDVERLTPEARLALLREAIGQSVMAIQRAAAVLVVMEEQGDDLSEIPIHILRMLRRINAQQLLPDVMVRLSGRLRQRTAMLPVHDQQRVLNNTSLDLVLADDTVAQIPPDELSPSQVLQVFGEGFIRTVEQQRVFRREHPEPESTMRRGRQPIEWQPDKDRGGVVINGLFVSKKKLLEILGDL